MATRLGKQGIEKLVESKKGRTLSVPCLICEGENTWTHQLRKGRQSYYCDDCKKAFTPSRRKAGRRAANGVAKSAAQRQREYMERKKARLAAYDL